MWTQNGDGPEHNGAQVESMVDCGKGVGEAVSEELGPRISLCESLLRKVAFGRGLLMRCPKLKKEGRFRSQLLIPV